MAVVHYSLIFFGPRNATNCAVNESETIFKWCPVVMDSGSVFIEPMGLEKRLPPTLKPMAMQFIDVVQNSVEYQAKFSRVSAEAGYHIRLVYTTQVNSAFRAIWLVPQSRDIKYYSPPGGFRVTKMSRETHLIRKWSNFVGIAIKLVLYILKQLFASVSVTSGGYLPRRSGSVNIHHYSPPLLRIIVKYRHGYDRRFRTMHRPSIPLQALRDFKSKHQRIQVILGKPQFCAAFRVIPVVQVKGIKLPVWKTRLWPVSIIQHNKLHVVYQICSKCNR